MRKPIDQEMRGLLTPRQRVWASIQALSVLDDGAFTRVQVQDGCNPMVSYEATEAFVHDLAQGGYVERVGTADKERGRLIPWRYRLTAKGRKHGAEAPLITQGGVPAQAAIGVMAMWRVMKVMPNFTFHDVAKAATLGECVVPPGTAKCYLKALRHAGYLDVVREGKPYSATVFRLARNTGPNPPAVMRARVVFDRNTGEMWSARDVQEVCDELTD